MQMHSDKATWSNILRAEQTSTVDICKLWAQVVHKTECLRASLRNPEERAIALRLLLIVQSHEQSKAVFPDLVELAAVGHSDIILCRSAIKSIPLDWVRSEILPTIVSSLKLFSGSPEVEEEAYRRYAELLREIDHDLLRVHVQHALRHPNQTVREVGIDFSD